MPDETQDAARRFIDAMDRLEAQGDPAALVALYGDDAEVGSSSTAHAYVGPDGARRFWSGYRRTFAEVRSTYRAVVASGDRAALEWLTDAVIRGQPVRYGGVTVLELRDGRIARSTAYFDPRSLGRDVTGSDVTGRDVTNGAAEDEAPAAEAPSGTGGVDARRYEGRGGWLRDPQDVG